MVRARHWGIRPVATDPADRAGHHRGPEAPAAVGGMRPAPRGGPGGRARPGSRWPRPPGRRPARHRHRGVDGQQAALLGHPGRRPPPGGARHRGSRGGIPPAAGHGRPRWPGRGTPAWPGRSTFRRARRPARTRAGSVRSASRSRASRPPPAGRARRQRAHRWRRRALTTPDPGPGGIGLATNLDMAPRRRKAPGGAHAPGATPRGCGRGPSRSIIAFPGPRPRGGSRVMGRAGATGARRPWPARPGRRRPWGPLRARPSGWPGPRWAAPGRAACGSAPAGR